MKLGIQRDASVGSSKEIVNMNTSTLFRSTSLADDVELTLACGAPVTGLNKFGDLPDEIQEGIVKQALTARYAIVDPTSARTCVRQGSAGHAHASSTVQRQNGTRRNVHGQATAMTKNATQVLKALHGEEATIFRSSLNVNLLRVNKLCLDAGIKALYQRNTFLFTNPGAMICFISQNPVAVSRVESVLMVMTVGQIPASFDRIARSASPNPLAPWLSICSATPEFANEEWMVRLGRPVSSAFAGLKSLTLHFLKWEQLEEVDARLDCPYTVEDNKAASVSRLTYTGKDTMGPLGGADSHPMSNQLCGGDKSPGAVSLDKPASQTRLLPTPNYVARRVDPVRIVKDANIHGWVRNVSTGGWQVPFPRITGLESLSDQDVVMKLVETMTRK